MTRRMPQLDKLNELGLKLCEDPDTPSSGISSLATPEVNKSSLSVKVATDWHAISDRPLEPPAAPLLKDLDSFTEGTGKGSFDSIPADDTNEFGELIHHPNPFSLGLLPSIDPSLSIETWRNEVSTTNTDREDIFDALADDSLDGLFDEPLLTFSNLPYDIPTDATPRYSKRARSSSPESYRRTKPRAKSLTSASSTPNVHDSLFSGSFELPSPPMSAACDDFLTPG